MNILKRPVRNFTKGRNGYRPIAIVMHIAEGTMPGAHAWFNNPSSKASSHYMIGKTGVIWQFVEESDTAWCNGAINKPTWKLLKPNVNPNLYTISIEHEGNCMIPETKVLLGNLQWEELGKLKVGDELIGFNENITGKSKYRKLHICTVLHTGRAKEQVYQVSFSNGQSLFATANHPWLIYKNESNNGSHLVWENTIDLLRIRSNRKIPVKIQQFFQLWSKKFDYEHGFLDCVFNGEGYLRQTCNTFIISFTQYDNNFLYKVQNALKQLGYNFRIVTRKHKLVKHRNLYILELCSGKTNNFRFLMELRPERLINNLEKLIRDQKISIDNLGEVLEVINVKSVGEKEIVTLTTSTGTYIAEGFGVHNSGEPWTDEMYHSDTELVNSICARWGIPKDRDHIIGHCEIDSVNKHRCPGSGFDFNRLLELINKLLEDPKVIAELQAQITNLKNQIDTLNRSISDLNNKYNTLLSDYTRLKEQYTTLETAKKQLEAENRSLKSNYSSKEAYYVEQIEGYKNTIMSLRKEKTEVEDELAFYWRSYNELKNKKDIDLNNKSYGELLTVIINKILNKK